jgi:hypothetical protein
MANELVNLENCFTAYLDRVTDKFRDIERELEFMLPENTEGKYDASISKFETQMLVLEKEIDSLRERLAVSLGLNTPQSIDGKAR